jgi:pilus assembly protein Flp/PilA
MLYAPADKGQGLVEYAMIIMLVFLVVIIILATLGPAIGNMFSELIPKI